MAIPTEKAMQMVRHAHGQAAQLDIAVTAVVVDPSGRMSALGDALRRALDPRLRGVS